MNLKKLIISLFAVTLLSVSAVAQKADIEVSYTKRSHYNNGVERINIYHLLANSGLSKFFNPKSETIDSINSTPEGRANFKKTQLAAMKAMMDKGEIVVDKLPRKKETDYIIKSSKDSLITVYDMLDDDQVYYTEPFSELTWEINDSTKNILGYECYAATTDYHGRRWTAWFAPEIPIQDGPWKFRGLPGLILEATSGNGVQESGFYADGIQLTSKEIKGVYDADKYERQDRKAILRARRAAIDNPGGKLAAKGLPYKVIINPENLKPKSGKSDFMETDYRE